MCKSWVHYGDTIFLDAMKCKLNGLHWKYIGPVAFDNEEQIIQLCECLCVEEDLDFYAWVQFIMGPFSLPKAKYDASKLETLVTADKPLLKSLSKNTTWLLVSGLYILDELRTTNGGTTEDNVAVHVLCYGAMGIVLPSPAPGTIGDFGDHMVTYTAVREWIAKRKKFVIVDRQFEGW